MRAFVTRHERLSIGLVLLLGLLIRLPAVPIDIERVTDVRLFMDWGRTARDLGFVAVSERIADGYGLYPPLSLWILDALAHIESLVPVDLRGGDTLLISMVKLLPVLADLAIALIVASLVRGRGPVIAVVGCAAIALNPAFIYLGATWGQIDSVYTLGLLAAAASMARPATMATVTGAWVSWAMAALIKVQGLLLAPLVLAATLRDAGWRRALVGMVVAGAITLLLFSPWLGGGMARYLETMSRVEKLVTINAMNLWYVASLGDRTSDARRLIGPVTPRILGYVMVLAVAAFVAGVVWWRRNRVGLALPIAVLSMAPYMVMTGMRGRYLLVALPFLILLALGWDRRHVLPRAGLVAVTVVITQTINLLAFMPPDPALWSRFTDRDATGPLAPLVSTLAMAASIANVVVFVWLLVSLARAARQVPEDLHDTAETDAQQRLESPGASTAGHPGGAMMGAPMGVAGYHGEP